MRRASTKRTRGGSDAVRRAGPCGTANEAEHDAYSNSTEPSVSPVGPRIFAGLPRRLWDRLIVSALRPSPGLVVAS